jgi:hypothetical protein
MPEEQSTTQNSDAVPPGWQLAGTHGFPFLHVAVAVGGTDDERREAHDLRLGT